MIRHYYLKCVNEQNMRAPSVANQRIELIKSLAIWRRIIANNKALSCIIRSALIGYSALSQRDNIALMHTSYSTIIISDKVNIIILSYKLHFYINK